MILFGENHYAHQFGSLSPITTRNETSPTQRRLGISGKFRNNDLRPFLAVVGATPKLFQCDLAWRVRSQPRHNSCATSGMGTPRGVLGRIAFDGKGGLSASFTVNTNGTVTHITDLGDLRCKWRLHRCDLFKCYQGDRRNRGVGGGKEFLPPHRSRRGSGLFNAARK
jgi:hypothetical protein